MLVSYYTWLRTPSVSLQWLKVCVSGGEREKELPLAHMCLGFFFRGRGEGTSKVNKDDSAQTDRQYMQYVCDFLILLEFGGGYDYNCC